MLKQFKSFWQKSWIFQYSNILNQQKPIQKFQMFEIIEENNINTLFNLSLRFFRSYSFRNLRHIWEFNYLLSSHFWKNQVKKTCLTPILFNWSFFVNLSSLLINLEVFMRFNIEIQVLYTKVRRKVLGRLLLWLQKQNFMCSRIWYHTVVMMTSSLWKWLAKTVFSGSFCLTLRYYLFQRLIIL